MSRYEIGNSFISSHMHLLNSLRKFVLSPINLKLVPRDEMTALSFGAKKMTPLNRYLFILSWRWRL